MCGGDFMSKNPEEAMDFLSYVADVSRGWDEPTKGEVGKMKSQLNAYNAKAGMYTLKEDDDMKAKLAAMTRRLEELELKRIHEVQAVAEAPVQVKLCPNCQSYEHLVEECPAISAEREMFRDQANVVGQFRPNNNAPYGNTYNSSWRNHPNFSWKARATQYQQPDPPSQQSSSLEQAIGISAREDFLLNPPKPKGVHEVESQEGESSQMKDVKALITLRSGKKIEQPTPKPHVEKEEEIKKGKEMEDKESEISEEKKDSDSTMNAIPEKELLKEEMLKKSTSPPFPQALHGKKGIRNAAEILEVLRQVKVNIPLLDMIKQVPTYAKFLKLYLTVNKKAFLTEQVSAILQSIGTWRVEANSNHSISADRSVKIPRGHQENCLMEVLKRCKKAIGWQISDLKGISPLVCTHHIYMEEEAKPIRQFQRRLNPHLQEVVRAEVLKLLQAGIIYPISDSPWVSPTQVVPKKSGITVVQNEKGKKLLHASLQCWRESLDIHSIVFLDGYSGYFQIEIDLADQEKTTFTCPFGTYAYRRMPFGLCNAPATFQRCMLSIFSDMVERIMEVFMDDITVYGGTFEECLLIWKQFFTDALKKTWCSTGRNAILWYVKELSLAISSLKKALKLIKQRWSLLSNYHPTTVKGVRQFLGHAGFYRRFIKGVKSFDQLKKFLTTTPIVRAPNWQLPFELMCDASDFAIGAVLGQREDGKPYVIYYASKTLNEAQRNYTTTEKELLAVVFALDKFRAYLVGIRFQIKDKKGVENVVADHLSRSDIRKCVPEDEQQGILSHCHENACGGHFASQKTAMKVLQSGFTWPSLFKDAHIMCRKL
ncbi:Retrovirus-related Pol polyprotein from transposon 17.6 [Vitis vinifera]|uniref:Retrovirus-related Pol polyprotein from transposon 17.6 n=1 Tax=Vitis vinifera TaxID=29760 RepID=A0A438CR87_VITVI|nr:Retrovirus-related Pol polyprotein from transposon 17.6 [Vitis vinifera]